MFEALVLFFTLLSPSSPLSTVIPSPHQSHGSPHPSVFIPFQALHPHQSMIFNSGPPPTSPQCVVKTYLQWLSDSEFSPNCALCQSTLDDGRDTIRLPCFGPRVTSLSFFVALTSHPHPLRRLPLGMPQQVRRGLSRHHGAGRLPLPSVPGALAFSIITESPQTLPPRRAKCCRTRTTCRPWHSWPETSC